MTQTSDRPSHNTRLGAYGEAVAARYLTRDLGMTLVDRNWRCPLGEIDLILRDGRVVVFCEVKTRTNQEHGHPVEAVDEEKVQRMALLAEAWCIAQTERPHDLRLDIVGVLLDGSRLAAIDHVPGVSA